MVGGLDGGLLPNAVHGAKGGFLSFGRIAGWKSSNDAGHKIEDSTQTARIPHNGIRAAAIWLGWAMGQ